MSVLLCRPLFSHNHSFSPRYYIGEPYLSKLMESVSSVDGHHLHHSTPIAGMYDLSKHLQHISLLLLYTFHLVYWCEITRRCRLSVYSLLWCGNKVPFRCFQINMELFLQHFIRVFMLISSLCPLVHWHTLKLALHQHAPLSWFGYLCDDRLAQSTDEPYPHQRI